MTEKEIKYGYFLVWKDYPHDEPEIIRENEDYREWRYDSDYTLVIGPFGRVEAQLRKKLKCYR